MAADTQKNQEDILLTEQGVMVGVKKSALPLSKQYPIPSASTKDKVFVFLFFLFINICLLGILINYEEGLFCDKEWCIRASTVLSLFLGSLWVAFFTMLSTFSLKWAYLFVGLTLAVLGYLDLQNVDKLFLGVIVFGPAVVAPPLIIRFLSILFLNSQSHVLKKYLPVALCSVCFCLFVLSFFLF